MTGRLLLAVLLVCVVSVARAGEGDVSAADQAAIVRTMAPSLVHVEYTLRYDKGERPVSGGWTRSTCPVRPYSTFSVSETVTEERPAEMPGALVAPTRVITADPMIHARFIESVRVRFGDQVVEARPSAYPVRGNGQVLELDKPLEGAVPLAFDAAAEGPYLAVTHDRQAGQWTTAVGPVSTAVQVTEAGEAYHGVPIGCLIVDSNGAAVGVSMTGRLPADGSWKGSPLDWPAFSADEMAGLVAKITGVADAAVLRVSLRFRSPKKESGGSWQMSREDAATEKNVLGLLVGERRVLVLAQMAPKATALLERVLVYPPRGDACAAAFESSLTDYGAFVARLEKPLEGALVLADGPILDCRDALLLSAEVTMKGEQRIAYFLRRRIPGFSIGWRQHVYPAAPGDEEGVFLFDTDGRLVALPVSRREKVSLEDRWRDDDAVLTAAADLRAVLADLAAHVDASNVPLSEEEENRLAWMGLVLQPLDRELARANEVSELTRDGEVGALVSYVYPGSPAAAAGVEPGMVLLRLHVEGYPKPLDVSLRDPDRFGGEGFPWDRLDQVPEQYYDRIPKPWPDAENEFTRALTDLGFGKAYEAEFVQGGQVVRKPFKVVLAPPHYAAAPKCKSDDVGLTVRDLTYEVRRYFQRAEDEPGVIVSKIEPGSKASVAGLKPYEIVTHVNDQPVMTADDFGKLIEGQTELRLSVKRMTLGRQVKIRMDAADRPSADEEAEPDGDQPAEPAEADE